MSLIKSDDEIIFVSGNFDKQQDANDVIGSRFKLRLENIDLKEIQGNESDVAWEKCYLALCQFPKNIVVIEDTSLKFDEFNGLPGPYIKHFNKAIGADGLYRMLHCYENKNATVISTVAIGIPRNFSENGHQQILLVNDEIKGKIVSPKGKNGDYNGWDPCFQPNDTNLTLGEMSTKEKKKYCSRIHALEKALKIIKNFLKK
uniref:Non-canonical purine NTP pyrophosphatase n=1 Tax=Panagrolaimus sp. JU765 TaxID=591449 RepID=A0AC34RNI1_9BILA